MPLLHSVTLCRCCAHIFFTPPLPCDPLTCLTSAVRCHASPLQSLLGGSTQCRCSASPSIRYHAVAARGTSQLCFAAASQCNALRALPLHNCSLPLPNHSLRLSAMPGLCRSFHTIAIASHFFAFPLLVASQLFRSLPCLCFSEPYRTPPLPSQTMLSRAVAAPSVSGPRLAFAVRSIP